MKPSYAMLKAGHFSADCASPRYRSCADIYADIGHDIATLTQQSPVFTHTAAVRMSLALLSASIPVIGRLPIQAGKHTGKQAEPVAKRLADQLLMRTFFGEPEIFLDPVAAKEGLEGKRGLVFFHRMNGHGGGHIDLIETLNASALCNAHCYFNCREVWFWELA